MHEAHDSTLEALRARVSALAQRLGETPKFLMGKPGLDGHSNGAEQIAVRAADTGLEVIYEGIRVTPEQLVRTVDERKVHILGLSILSGSHVPLVREVMNRLRAAGLGHVPVVAGGIIPSDDVNVLKQLGVAAVYTPKDFDMNRIMDDLIGLIEKKAGEAAA
jgi:(2R)-ethylmalonyl-CoA mutase